MSSRVLVALRVPGSPDRAFRVFTEDVAVWWRHSPLFQFTPGSPGVLKFEPPADGRIGRFVETLANGKTFVIGDIILWRPGRDLIFNWRQATFAPSQTTTVEVTFEAVGDETRVTVMHGGWDSVPPDHVARHGLQDLVFNRRLGAWWRDALAALPTR